MADDVYQVAIMGEGGGQFAENIMHFANHGMTGGDPVADAVTFIGDWQASVQPDFLAAMPADYALLGLSAKRVNNGGGPTVVTPTPGVFGTSGSNTAQSACAPCIIFQYLGALAWKAGKLFMQMALDGEIGDNEPTPGYTTLLTNFINAMFPSFTGGRTWDLVVWSRKFTVAYIPAATTISLKLGIQKRRLKPAL